MYAAVPRIAPAIVGECCGCGVVIVGLSSPPLDD
jgi:hypothetical protein